MSVRPCPSASVVRRHHGAPARDYLPVDAARLFGWLYPELAAQDAHACLVLTQRIPETPLASVQTYQRPVSLLSQGVERQELDGSLDGRFRRAGLRLMRHEPSQGMDGSFPQAGAFTTKPLLEELLADVDAIQKIPDVEGSSLLQLPRAFLGGQPFELGNVDIDRGPIERDAIAFDQHDSGMKRR
jgi:hypothetical protein